MGRKPEGALALTGAERQARYRARTGDAPAGVPVRPVKPRALTRPARWRAAVSELLALQAEYAVWLDALPEATRDGPTGEALLAILEIDLSEIASIEPPRGYGRD